MGWSASWASEEDSVSGNDHCKTRALIGHKENTVRNGMRGLPDDMDPFAFEHVIGRQLEKMGCQNVVVTAQSHDDGVDVAGDNDLGITSVRDISQVKRYPTTIQRKICDVLHGTLYRFYAVRKIFVTASQSAKRLRKLRSLRSSPYYLHRWQKAVRFPHPAPHQRPKVSDRDFWRRKQMHSHPKKRATENQGT